MSGRLVGKVALVTGASSGIGEATALALAAEGAAVALAARRAARLNALAARIMARGGAANALACDVSSDAVVHEMVERAHAWRQRLDILVNNAGVMYAGPITGADTAEWRRMVELNELGLFYCTHAALPYMLRQRAGHIVNISSTRGHTAYAGYAVYSATKWAVQAFSEALRQEVHGQGIRVTIIAPGATESELADHTTNAQMKQQNSARIAGMEQLKGEDVAAAVIYAVTQPARVNVNEILMRSIDQD